MAICSALSHRGTRCALRIFMRGAGIVHVAASKTISAAVANRVSPDRHAVRIVHSSARADGQSLARSHAMNAGAS